MSKAQMIFEKQWLHASLLAALLAGLGMVSGFDGVRSGQLWGVTTPFTGNEDEAHIAGVPELPGCAADGATYKQAVAKVEVVIGEWIQTARELGRPVPERKGCDCRPANRRPAIKNRSAA